MRGFLKSRSRARDLAFSRSTNFWILPVEVLGTSANPTARGALKLARCKRGRIQVICFSLVELPAFSSTKAQESHPISRPASATTAAAEHRGGRLSGVLSYL